jgi:hypothetical protein
MSSSSKSNAIVLTLIMIAMIIGASMYFLGGEVKSDKYVIRQEFFTGKMSAITNEGWYFKFGYVTEFNISDIIWFSVDAEEGRERDESIRVRFNDGASAQISGSVRFILPTDPNELIKLKKQFGTFERIKKELVIQVVNEAIYLTASLMSSKESYTTKRSLFSDYAQDQALNGVFRTRTNEILTKDSISGEVTTRTEIEILRDEDTGEILRKESALRDYGIKLKNFVVKRIQYPENILIQLDEQQQALMDVQKAKAMAQKAEQEAITAEKDGFAKIAVAKAQEGAIKIKAVVQAQQLKEVAVLKAEQALAVAKLDKEAAKEYKEAKDLRAEADANAARKLIQADGALKQKLATYENVMKFWAEAYTKQRPTPDIVIGGGEDKKGSGNAAEQFMNLLIIKALKDLSLDMNVKKK